MRIERLVVMVSGGGTNLQAIIDACSGGRINAKVAGVISSKPGVYALERAKKMQIPSEVIKPSDFSSKKEHDAAVLSAIEKFGGQAVILAGYLSMIGPDIISRYKVINIHPALIPAFCGKGYYGHHVHEAVISYGAKVSGATVHFVDEGTDTGPIIMQKCVPVLDGDTPDTLDARVLKAEHEILVESVRLFCDGKLYISGRRVNIKE